MTGSGSGASWGKGVAFKNSSHISVRITLVGIAVTTGDGMMLIAVGVDTGMSAVPVQDVNNRMEMQNKKINVRLSKYTHLK